MKVSVLDDYKAMSERAAELMERCIVQKPEALVCIPSGDTPTQTLALLVNRVKQGSLAISNCHFVGLDEWVGMDKNDHGSCQHYQFTHFFDPLTIPDARLILFQAKERNLGAECERVDDHILRRGGIDLALVGVGINGHIGLNEPGVSPDLYSHVSTLDPITVSVAAKYFGETKPLEKGITLGLRHLMEARTLIVIANGEKKADIIHRIVEGEVTRQVPGSLLQRHKNCHVLLDASAAQLLRKKNRLTDSVI